MNKPLIASCLTGMTACSLAFAANIVGLNNVSVYAVNIHLFYSLALISPPVNYFVRLE